MRIESLSKFEKKVLRDSVSQYVDLLTEEQLLTAYYTKIIKKKDNSDRVIQCIDNEHMIYKIQKQLKNNFLDFIPLSNHAYGYVKGKSYYDYLKPHVKHGYYMKVDIKDFFHSIKEKKLRDVLKYYIDDVSINENLTILDFIIKVVTVNNYLPQGAVTSPVLSNIYFRLLDIRISRYCRKFGINYTRYVDDLLFSSDNLFIHKRVFINGITKILKSQGFKLNPKKVRKTKSEISLNGFVVGEDVRLSRKKTAIISALIYCNQRSPNNTLEELLSEIEQNFEIKVKIPSLHNFLAGYRSFLLGLLPFDSVGVLPEVSTRTDKKILYKINEIEKILDLTAPII
ncbi:reverse transcriptase family protein [Paenibacillus thiaminolyticus]|uniref:reverse transcriptase family protein n=1 Tax=Paenibacillus thiaminolyticus TaxID=49283 RepID=UPI00234FD709|nr:reverse transcriptase family protein [Paenibacillus thiaminolyticus]WCR29479.1 reverse transcriptase family protein [Paenibacillus thiaminolyticus]